MLERVWRKEKPWILLVTRYIGTATMENSISLVQSLSFVWQYEGS